MTLESHPVRRAHPDPSVADWIVGVQFYRRLPMDLGSIHVVSVNPPVNAYSILHGGACGRAGEFHKPGSEGAQIIIEDQFSDILFL